MSDQNRRRLSASGVKNNSQLLNNTNACSLLNHLNTKDSFLPDSGEDESNDSANATNISDEVNDGFRFLNNKLKSFGLIDWKEFEDSLDCDGDLAGWCREMRPGQMTNFEPLLLQQLILKAQEEVKEHSEHNQQQEACIALIKAKHKRELADSHAEINALREENEQLRTALLKSQTEISRIQTQLDKLKQEFMDQESVELKANWTPCPLNRNTMDRSSPVGLTPHLDWSTAKMSSRRCDKIPGSYMPAQRRILFLNSGLSDSESVLDPLSCGDVSESDREGALELGQESMELHTTLENFESPCSGYDMSCQRKLRPGPPIQLFRGALSSEEPRSEPTYRLVLAGDVGSGKSSFLLRLSQHQFRENMRSTVGVDCQIKRMLVDGKKMALQIWDTAGQERFHSISRSYFRKANGILLLYDITSEKSFLNITQWLEQIEACTTTSVPLCLVGNKADLRGKVPSSLCVSSTCGMRLATTCGALFFETSAKDGTNVVEAVLHLAREVKKVGGLLTNSTLQLSTLGDRDPPEGNCCWVLA